MAIAHANTQNVIIDMTVLIAEKEGQCFRFKIHFSLYVGEPDEPMSRRCVPRMYLYIGCGKSYLLYRYNKIGAVLRKTQRSDCRIRTGFCFETWLTKQRKFAQILAPPPSGHVPAGKYTSSADIGVARSIKVTRTATTVAKAINREFPKMVQRYRCRIIVANRYYFCDLIGETAVTHQQFFCFQGYAPPT